MSGYTENIRVTVAYAEGYRTEAESFFVLRAGAYAPAFFISSEKDSGRGTEQTETKSGG